MQTKIENLWMKKDEVFASPLASIKPRKLNGGWDYISSPISNFKLRDTDNINPNHQNLLLKSANLEIESQSTTEGSNQSWSCFNANFDDSEELSNEIMHIEAIKQRNDSKRSSWAAPAKKQNKRKHKEILKEFDRKQLSFPMTQINDAFENIEPLFILPDHDDGLSLEEHIFNLSKGNLSNDAMMTDRLNIDQISWNNCMNSENLNISNLNKLDMWSNSQNQK